MHAYARNCTIHPTLIALISILSIVLASVIGVWANRVGEWIGISASGLSAVSIFGLLWVLFDRWLWKVRLIRNVLLVPDLNGSWRCVGKTVSKGDQKVEYDWEAQITICQSWSKILVRLETTQSSSKSIAASLYHEGDQRYRLIYHYANDPKPSEEDLRRHSGLTDLLFDASVETAGGRYFTDGDRLTVGEMQLTREGAKNGHSGEA